MPLELKPVPRKVLDALQLLPPNPDYSFFAAAASRIPFQHGQKEFQLVNATWLADAALLAYLDKETAGTKFENTGLRKVEFFSTENTQAHAAVWDEFVVVSFRGTQVNDLKSFLEDNKTNARIRLAPAGDRGRVHSGFSAALDLIWPSLLGFLDDERSGPNANRSIWFTGHSLGGALATLAFDRYPNATGLYTFAAPRVGDVEYAAGFPASGAYRLVNNNDVIPRIPPPQFGYKHVGIPYSIDADGKVSEGIAASIRPGDSLHDVNFDVIGAAMLNLFDHAPILYATHLWNAFATATNSESPAPD